MNRFLLILTILLSLVPVTGFSGEQVPDSIIRKLDQMSDNKSKVDSLIEYMPKVKDSALTVRIFNKALQLSTSINYTQGMAESYDKLGVIKRNLSNYPEALALHKKALEVADNTSDKKLKIQILNNIGVVYRRLDENKLALDFHMKALKMAEELNDVKNICISVNSIGNIYISLNQLDDALKCFKRSLPLERNRGNAWGVAINLQNIGYVYEAQNNLDSALYYYKGSLNYDIQANKIAGIAICYNSIGEVYLKKHEYERAVEYFNHALVINEQIGDKIYISVSYTNIGDAFLQEKNYAKAIDFFQKGLDIALKIGSKSQAQVAYEGLSKVYQNQKKYETALECYKKSVAYADSVLNEDNVRHVTLIYALYNTEKQQNQIKILEKEKVASRLQMLILTILFTAIVVIALFYYRNLRQKRKITQQELHLKEQKIRELEKHHQLLATQSVLQGEEAERSRLAKDLHDGLGGLLSGIKLTLSNMKGNIVFPSESVELYNKALNMLDSSIQELRRVAHNMMPEALVKFGLKDALSDFCNSLHSKQININFQCYGDEKRVDPKIEISLYRIAQELINNAFKHSQATTLIVQLVQEENRINLTVQDNGKGFDTAILRTSKGAGIANIRSRVESLNGVFDFYSEQNKGTEVNVEFRW
ncbi:MAG TPA: sensor histidine kinase [Bacteroidales bacterium]